MDEFVRSELYELQLPTGESIDLEWLEREDWEGLADNCPDCGSEEYQHVRYEGGHYGPYQDAVVLRTDYWYQKGALYTSCLGCDEVLFKHPAFDIIEELAGELEP